MKIDYFTNLIIVNGSKFIFIKLMQKKNVQWRSCNISKQQINHADYSHCHSIIYVLQLINEDLNNRHDDQRSSVKYRLDSSYREHCFCRRTRICWRSSDVLLKEIQYAIRTIRIQIACIIAMNINNYLRR